jgi:Ni/Co efflux regulator RcnB
MAMSLAAAGLAFAQGNDDRNDGGRNESLQPGVQQDISDNELLLLNRPDDQGSALDAERRDKRGAGPNHAYHRGDRLPPNERNRQYVVDDWRSHGLLAPAPGYHWVQTGGDYVLVAIPTGVIVQLLLDEEIRNEEIQGQDAFWGHGNHSIFCESENSCA